MQSIDIIRLLGKGCQQITIEHKNQLMKTSLLQDCRNICDQDRSKCKNSQGYIFNQSILKQSK